MNSSDLASLYTEYSGKVMAYLTARVQRRADAEDLCEEVFEKICKKIGDYDEEKASLSTWIFNITRNTLIDHFRKIRPVEDIDENIPSDITVEASLLNRETLQELAKALKMLPQEQRDIVVLLYYDRKPMTEIAQMMRLSYGAVKLRHQKALSELRKYMNER